MHALTKVYRDHPKTLLFTSAAALRLLLAITFPALPDLLTGRVEISTPVNSFKRCMCSVYEPQHESWRAEYFRKKLRQKRSAGRPFPL